MIPPENKFNSIIRSPERQKKNQLTNSASHFHITQMGKESLPCILDKSAIRTAAYEIIWCTHGTGVLQIDTQIIPVTSGTVYCITPGQLRAFDYSDDFSGYHVLFSREFLVLSGCDTSKLFLFNDRNIDNLSYVILIEQDIQSSLCNNIRRMLAEFACGKYQLRLELLSGLLFILLVDLTRSVGHQEKHPLPPRDIALVNKFLQRLKSGFKEFKMVNDYAEQLNITPYRLNRAVKIVTGLTVRQVIHQQIVIEAKRQVIHQRCSMKEIAYDLGFDNLAHFSKLFKHKSGMTFSEFRRDALQC